MFSLIDTLIVRPIVNILFVIYSVVGDFGVAIIIFTIIVKLALWPLVKKQMAQTRAMREIQPELLKIRKNAKGNKQIESLQTMELYKKHNIKPFSSILTVLIQFPIFIALFTAINVSVRPCAVDNQYNAPVEGTVCAAATKEKNKTYTVSHSAYPFVRKLNNVNTLIDQQDIYLKAISKNKSSDYKFRPKLFGLLDLSQKPNLNFQDGSFFIFILALAAAAIQYLTLRQQNAAQNNNKKKKSFKQLMQEAADGKEADQSDITNMVSGSMTKFMPIMMLFIMLALPGAIILYYILISIITFFQQKVLLSPDYEKKTKATAAAKAIEKQADKYQAQEAQIVSKPKQGTNQNKKSKTNITRISASTKKKRRK